MYVTETTFTSKPVLPISAYPRIHMSTGTAWSNQWQDREEMVLERCQAGSSEWPYMVKSAVSRVSGRKWQRQRQLSGVEVLEHDTTKVWGKTLYTVPSVAIVLFMCRENSFTSSQTSGYERKTHTHTHTTMNGGLRERIQTKHTPNVMVFLYRECLKL